MALEDVYRKIGFLANTAGGGARAENAIAVAAVPAAPAAVLWDMDGTLVDSEEEWARVSGNVVRAHGGIWTDEDIVAIRGADTIAHGRRMMDAVRRGGGEVDPWKMFAEVLRAMADHMADAQLIDGAGALLDAFSAAGIPQALVTATPGRPVEIFLAGPGSRLEAAVTGDDDVPGKPNPAPYLLGAERLGVAIENCLAFEDSGPGLAAARSAGAFTVDVGEFPLVELAALL
ncbi:MAG: HAD family phosphatase [Actinotignum sanguinis]|uniref:HAD family hydrolase n=1 Tax=Actinotignum sanguinis TaxID=1445614 RepID=UPI00237E60C0|nr:HAD family phosphatase [Actinotignum sanguinis]MDE1552732.1 HAD family phosphatase [Actinotignum sanguinis]MDE1576459.1 HAD family phosphatase [Actinotignum sanguinis]MDE1642130.1 HAD family phosphatase [Actinotignum sanguinis]MDK8286596.1 HAD family phosphatase [Actinotignum sanguinis]MDK8353922.1 HAD family phosphatase [Actinotignum sanguinis]